MAITPPYGVIASGKPPSGDRANAVVTGTFGAVGPSQPFSFEGPLNVSIWGSLTTTLSTTQGSNAASVTNGTGIAAGTAVNSINVPPGTTWATFSGTSGTLALPTVTLDGDVNPVSNVMRGLRSTTGLVGATVTGPGIQAGTTVTAILVPATPNSPGLPTQFGGSGSTLPFGQIRLSNPPIFGPSNNQPQKFTFALTPNAITSGSDANAVMTGAGITFSASVQIERSFDGGATWLLCNLGGGGSLAQYSAGTPVALTFGEPETNVLYRLNCTSYSSGVVNYRLSETGAAATSLSLGSPT